MPFAMLRGACAERGRERSAFDVSGKQGGGGQCVVQSMTVQLYGRKLKSIKKLYSNGKKGCMVCIAKKPVGSTCCCFCCHVQH
jgi:hypothetical protein